MSTPITAYGPADWLQPGMLCFVDHLRYAHGLARLASPGVVLTTLGCAGEVEATGNEPCVVEDPRQLFWQLFREQMSTITPDWYRSTLCLGEMTISPRASIAPSAVIGGLALKTYKGVLVPNAGGVMIEDGASVGDLSSVGAGIYGEDTEIHRGAHIDNLVHVGHGVTVGAGATVTAGTIIGGWSVIGEGAWIGIGSRIRDNIRVGKNAMVGMGSVVIRDVPPGATVVGNPARVLEQR